VPDQRTINRLKLMLMHAQRTLEHADPDLKVVEKLLADALSLSIQLAEPSLLKE
jgi:hypothetical protein